MGSKFDAKRDLIHEQFSTIKFTTVSLCGSFLLGVFIFLKKQGVIEQHGGFGQSMALTVLDFRK